MLSGHMENTAWKLMEIHTWLIWINGSGWELKMARLSLPFFFFNMAAPLCKIWNKQGWVGSRNILIRGSQIKGRAPKYYFSNNQRLWNKKRPEAPFWGVNNVCPKISVKWRHWKKNLSQILLKVPAWTFWPAKNHAPLAQKRSCGGQWSNYSKSVPNPNPIPCPFKLAFDAPVNKDMKCQLKYKKGSSPWNLYPRKPHIFW